MRAALYQLHQPDVVHLRNHLVHDRQMPRLTVDLHGSQRLGRYLWSHNAVRRSMREADKIKEALVETKEWLLRVAHGDPSFLEDQVESVFSSLAAVVDRGELTGVLRCTALGVGGSRPDALNTDACTTHTCSV